MNRFSFSVSGDTGSFDSDIIGKPYRSKKSRVFYLTSYVSLNISLIYSL